MYDPLAQLAEHLTFNQGVWSSNLQWVTSHLPLTRDERAGVARNGRRARLRIWCRKAYEFKSLRPHTFPGLPPWLEAGYAVVAQLVERHLAKVEVAGPSPVYRSNFYAGVAQW